MAHITEHDIKEVIKLCGCGAGIAKELLTLAGGELQIVLDASFTAGNLSQVKANIIDARFNQLNQHREDDKR